jgi:YbbR domain-containing protein
VRCLIISFIAWLLIAVSNKYTITIKAGIEYVNLPEKRAFHSLQSDTVNVNLLMSGWNVLLHRINPKDAVIQVDLSTLATRNFIVFSHQLGFINRQFPTDKQAVKVSPDTLYFDFSTQTQRKVEIKVPTRISFKKQYGIIGETKTTPQYVTVTGPADDIKNIDFLQTDTVYGDLIHTDIRTIANINRQQRTNISIYPTSAEVSIPVGELTEKQIEVPIHILNAKKYTSVRVIPTKVTLTAMVSLRDYAKWTSSDFEVVVDLDNWEKNHVSSLPIQLTKAPDFCEVIRIEPQNVDFFVRK